MLHRRELEAKVGRTMGEMMGGGMMGGAVIWSLVVLLLLAVAATALVLLAVRSGRSGTDRPSGRSTTGREADEILRSRYAAGEIDDEEYRRRLALLNSSA